MIYKFSQLYKKISYKESKYHREISTTKFHIGQLKLLLSEIIFLTKHSKNNNKVLYIGAAAGTHTAYLADMFPFLTFDLWDPGKFDIEPRNNIKIFNNLFTYKNAFTYKNQGDNILFISDIRSLVIAEYKKSKDMKKMNEIVSFDLDIQKKWVKIITPIYAYLKFRLPYGEGDTEYFKGTIYLQPYSPNSTEARLMTNNYNDMVYYNNEEFDQKMAFFNCCIRNKNIKYKRWADIMHKYKIKNNWDNTYAFYILDYYLRKIKKIKSDQEVVNLFFDIVKFLSKKNPDKFKPLFYS